MYIRNSEYCAVGNARTVWIIVKVMVSNVGGNVRAVDITVSMT